MKRIAAVAAVLLIAPAAAQAARPELSVGRADRAAARVAEETVAAWSEEYDATNPDDSFITAYDLDTCDRTSRTSVDCDITYWLNDGSGCDGTITIHTTRRNKLSVNDDDLVCDGDPDYDD